MVDPIGSAICTVYFYIFFCLFLHQSTYSTFPSFMNSHFTFAPSLAEEIFFERALNSISKSNLKTNIRQDLYDNDKNK